MATETHFTDTELNFDLTAANVPVFVPAPMPTKREMSKAGPRGAKATNHNADAVRANKRLSRKTPASKSKVAASMAHTLPALPAEVMEAIQANKLACYAPRRQREEARKAARLALTKAGFSAVEAADIVHRMM